MIDSEPPCGACGHAYVMHGRYDTGMSSADAPKRCYAEGGCACREYRPEEPLVTEAKQAASERP